MLYCLNAINASTFDLGKCLLVMEKKEEAMSKEDELVVAFQRIMEENVRFKLIVIQTICSQSSRVFALWCCWIGVFI